MPKFSAAGKKKSCAELAVRNKSICNHLKRNAKRKPWLKPDSDAFKALQTIILDKNTSKYLQYLTNFSQTASLQI